MRRSAIRPDINVTPLVDVVLVLLIIFMVIAPQMEAGAAVDLPGILNADAKDKSQLEPITVSLTSKGTLYVEKELLARDALVARLHALHDAEPNRKVLVKADRNVPYGKVRGLFAECREIGFPGLSMQVGDKKPGSSEGK